MGKLLNRGTKKTFLASGKLSGKWNFWTKKPSWQGETFWKELLEKVKALNKGKASRQGGYFLVQKAKTFYIGEGFGLQA
jgi:hypothetical protein